MKDEVYIIQQTGNKNAQKTCYLNLTPNSWN